MKAAHLLVRCLETEGVQHVFGIPGEETIDLNEALDSSSVRFVPVRHEQAGAFIADVWGRLTGRAGVCLGTLGPGATNLVTGIADAYLDRAPLVALTGQGNLDRMHKESHQYLDVMAMMRPLTKWNARIADADIVPEAVRKAFKVAEASKPGPTHLELPEGVMASETDRLPLPRHPAPAIEPQADDVARAAELIRGAEQAVVLAGNGVVRGRATAALREFARRTGIGVAETFMGKGVVPFDDPADRGAVGLQAGDYDLAGFGDAEVVIAVGYDLVEHAPSHWNPSGDKRIVCIDSLPAETDEHFIPEVELVGDLAVSLTRLTEACGPVSGTSSTSAWPLREAAIGRLGEAASDDHFPMRPPRLLYELRRALGRDDVLISDVGLHKLWIGRLYPAYEPNTVLIANGLAGMGFAVPAAIAAKLARPEAKVVAVSGDGGFMMNCQELETAARLRTPFVNVVWENREYGSIVWKQDRAFGRHFGTGFTNPDFVAFAESFGLPAWRVERPEEMGQYLTKALALDVPSLIVVPVDYSADVAIAAGLGAETTAT
jgi:acetolactate synthase-1/2/3 large subunit